MAISIRHRLSPIAGIVTLAVGIIFSCGVHTLLSAFSTPVAVVRAVPAPAQDYDFFSTPRVETPATSTPTEFSCYDPHLLPIWHELKKDAGFKDWTNETGQLNCSELLDVARVDLKGDGEEKEFLVRGKDAQMCSSVGNCGFWILGATKKGVRMLLSSTDFSAGSQIGEQIQPKRSKGYATILLKHHFTAAETGYTTYSFDGKEYVESRCVFEVPKHARHGEGSMEIISCKEFDRRLQNGSANDDIRTQYWQSRSRQ
jgi:hypothetical protein